MRTQIRLRIAAQAAAATQKQNCAFAAPVKKRVFSGNVINYLQQISQDSSAIPPHSEAGLDDECTSYTHHILYVVSTLEPDANLTMATVNHRQPSNVSGICRSFHMHDVSIAIGIRLFRDEFASYKRRTHKPTANQSTVRYR